MLSLDRRPKSFDDFVGQKTTIKEMERRASQKDWPSVMFFVGPSGTGKTSLALVIAALMQDSNPLSLKSGKINPNLESPEVKDIFNLKFHKDVSFYDASSMSKEDVLKLQEQVRTPSMYGDKKVIIIDEAQELSKAGKGATLNLLEKLNSSVHIILCTMEPDKFDKAILSRGQVYTFRNPTTSEIAEHLFSVTESFLPEKEFEEIPNTFFEEVLTALAESSEGNVRTALQYLERSLNSKLYTEQSIIEELGIVGNATLTKTVESMVKGEVSCIEEIQKIGVKEYFYKSWKILIDGNLATLGATIKPEWKARFAKKISIEKSKIEDLLSLYSNVESKSPYFQERIFLTDLILWIKRINEIPLLEKKNEEYLDRERSSKPRRKKVG